MIRKLARLTGSLAILTPLALVTVSSVHAQPASPSHSAALVKVKAAHVLANASGKTLYVFAPDGKDKSTCYKTCAKYWPPVTVKAGTTPAKTVKGIPGTFGVTMRTDGTHQLTYDGAPLYTYVGDKDAGDTYGQGLFISGGYWWAVVAAGPAS